MEHKYYILYQTTNLVNGKIYIGKHETDNLDDGYMGSGYLLKKAIKKYGIENFTFRVLIFLHNREELNLLEESVVTQEFCARKDTYNINTGGNGGWHYINNQREQFDDDSRKQWCQNVSEGLKRKWRENPQLFLKNQHKINPMAFKGKHHTEESKQKIGQKNHYMLSGENNPNYGKVWINHPDTGRKIMINPSEFSELEKLGWKLGRVSPRIIDETNPAHLRCWINNGIESKFVLKSEQEQFLSEGWKHGRLPFMS